MRIIDISAPLDGAGPYWPGSPGCSLHAEMHVARGDKVTNSTLRMDVHAGTHVDAPAHHLLGGATVDCLPLDAMIGPALVVEVGCGVSEITAEVLRSEIGPSVPERVLFKTRSSSVWSQQDRQFDPTFVALTLDAATLLAEGGARLVGVDSPSVQRFGDADATHRVLFEAGVVVLEGLDLRRATGGEFQMVCLPMLLVGAEAAPARVVLIQDEEDR